MYGIDSWNLKVQYMFYFNWRREDISPKYCSMYVSPVKSFTLRHVVQLGVSCFWNRWTEALSLSTLLTSRILHTENRHSLIQCHHEARKQHNYVHYVKFGNHRVRITDGSCIYRKPQSDNC